MQRRGGERSRAHRPFIGTTRAELDRHPSTESACGVPPSGHYPEQRWPIREFPSHRIPTISRRPSGPTCRPDQVPGILLQKPAPTQCAQDVRQRSPWRTARSSVEEIDQLPIALERVGEDEATACSDQAHELGAVECEVMSLLDSANVLPPQMCPEPGIRHRRNLPLRHSDRRSPHENPGKWVENPECSHQRERNREDQRGCGRDPKHAAAPEEPHGGGDRDSPPPRVRVAKRDLCEVPSECRSNDLFEPRDNVFMMRRFHRRKLVVVRLQR